MEYQLARKKLVNSIKSAKERSWNNLCEAVENDPWGLPYKVVSKKLRTSPPGAEAKGRERQIAEYLFPTLPTIEWTNNPQISPTADEDLFTLEELRTASCRLSSGKASGTDGVPNEILRHVASIKPSALLDALNVCLRRQ